MKKLLLIILMFLLLSGTSFAADAYRTEAPLEWKTCSVDADCDAVAVGCWFWVIANKKYLPQVQATIGSQACASSIAPGPKPAVACINQVCVNEWTACTQDNECTAAVVRCSLSKEADWKPVNKKYIKGFEHSERNDPATSILSCNWNTFDAFDAGSEPKSNCVDKACKLSW